MGNKFTFVFIFGLALLISPTNDIFQKVQAEEEIECGPGYVSDPKLMACVPQTKENSCAKNQAFDYESGECEYVDANGTTKTRCLGRGGKWDSTTNTCKMEPDEKSNSSSGECSAVPNSTAKPHPVAGGTEIHCECNFPVNGRAEVKPQYSKYGSNQPSCLTENEAKAFIKNKDKGSDSTSFACLANLMKSINECEESAEEAVQSCDQKSAKNSQIVSPIDQVLKGGTQIAQGTISSLAQCQSVALTSATAGYALGQVQSNCKKDKSSCESTCNNLAQYKKVSAIEALCANDSQAQADKEGLHSEASQLAATLKAAYSECNVSTQALMNSLGDALQTAMKASAATQQCQSVFGSKDQIVPPITNACISNPAAPGCPVNCASASFASSPQCKCILNPNDSSCKGGQGPGKSTVASGSSANQSYNGIGAGASGMPKINSDISGIKLDDEDVTDSSPTLPAETASAASNVAAQKASAPGGGSGGSSGANKGEAATEAGKEEGGFLGATFKTLKNAANNLFGGRSGSSSKNNLNNKEAQNRTDYKKKTGIRGLASNANCYIDATGTEYCLNMGKRNRDIFQMINLGYSKQYHTLLVD